MADKLPILHIVVIGFHHKKGCQVEFSYPPLIAGTEGKNECPSGWKYLPTLALPDGSHNFKEDTVFFNLPSLLEPTESVYGVSCYRQIPVEKLKIKTADVTRSTVQKSVCILSRLPIYGYIEVKLSLIADAFFDQGDFSCTEILVKAFNQLNACLEDDIKPLRHIEVGLPIRDIILKWRHKTLLLFKLFLLQKRIVCFCSPVKSMCALIIGISSLYPKLIEKGFKEIACVRTSRPMSPMPDFNEKTKVKDNNSNEENKNNINELILNDNEKVNKKSEENNLKCENDLVDNEKEEICIKEKSEVEISDLNRTNSNGVDIGKRLEKSALPRESSMDTLASTLFPLSSISPDAWNAPIPIFSSGHLCLPYLSLPYMDLLTDISVLSYVIGTSNILFQQKKNLADIQIDVENGTIETNDTDLRRQLVLTTEDLRFIDYVIRNVQNPKEDAEGSEGWIREQFRGYILALLKTAVTQDNVKDCDHFNAHFITAFRKTHCFQEWDDLKPDEEFFETIPSGHPFAGTLSVSDMKLKIAQTMHNSESGRKINQAVNTTSRAVGGAISHAKGAFSNWWSSITTASPQQSNSNVTLGDGFEDSLVKNVNLEDENPITEESSTEVIAKEATVGNKDVAKKVRDIEGNDGGIVEIAKEAEILDSNRKAGDVFTV